MKFIKTPKDNNGRHWFINVSHIVGFKNYEDVLKVYLSVTPPSTMPHSLKFIGVSAEDFNKLCA